MRRIIKRGEPVEFQRYRRSTGEPPSTFADMPAATKVALREALLAEQGWLCCYCMRRVDSGSCRLEHWEPQSKPGSTRQLDYRNLFAACTGDLGSESHCDVSKENKEITLDPLTVDPRWFGYRRDGCITAHRERDVDDVVRTLRLNTAGLMHRRKTQLTVFLNRIGPRSTAWSKSRLEKALARSEAPRGDGRLDPFCEMFACWLRKRIDRM